MSGKASSSSPRKVIQEQAPPMRHSNAPGASRGGSIVSSEKEKARSSGGRSGSDGPRRSGSFLSFASLWQTPRDKLRSMHNGYDENVVEDDDEEEEEEGQIAEKKERGGMRGPSRSYRRERSNSMPTSPMSEDNGSFFTATEDLERTFSGSSSIKRKSLQMPPNAASLTTAEEENSHLASPSLLARTTSRSPSILDARFYTSAHYPSRGYAWRKEEGGAGSAGGGFVHPSHRNPTGMQAFYDSHFGSSSGWRSVAGMADDVLHPFEKTKQTLGRWSGMKKDKKAKEEEVEPSKVVLDRKKDSSSLFNWNALNSLGIFGINSGSSDSKVPSQDEPSGSRAYEAELIPTIQRDPHVNRYFKNLEGNVVVMGGYRGSILRDAETHQMMWVPLKVGVGLRRPTLDLGLTSEAEDNSEDRVIADEMLGGIGSMVDMGRRLINRCSTKRTNVHNWGYDWRLSLSRSSTRLETYLYDLWLHSAEKEQDRRGAKVIAHSMGGLVALHALSRTTQPEIFESIIFASTPFLGTANILGPFRIGDAALFNDEICSPRATFSFRSSFYLLPTDADLEDDAVTNTRGGRCFEEEDGTPHDLDFLDAETWNDLGFSPCVQRGKRNEVLEKSRKRAKREGFTLGEKLQKSASIKEMQGVRMEDDQDRANVEVPSISGPNLSMMPSSESSKHEENASSRLLDKAGGTAFEAAKAGHDVLSKIGSNPDDKEALQPGNRKDGVNDIRRQNSTLSDSEWQEILDDEASAAWLYLERTLVETRQFHKELRTGFKKDYHEKGRYPNIAILTSGRTPTVRGALVAPSSSAASFVPDKAQWKEGVRQGDYSRLLYAPGDGVILRRSATTLPGQWGELLVRGKEDDVEALTNHEGVVETSHRHVTLLSDVSGIGRCLEACRRANSKTLPVK
ncbi:hypothetical protein CBS101457_002336 [Exobasidium rhododendri]|nr:hypothetical protein CBS101457_002336 [Exobasidium rhododendri]